MSYGISPTSNRLTTLNSTAVSVDAAGNLTSKPGLALAYDDWSRLRTATGGGVTTTYGVNGLGERTSKTQGTTQRIYVYSAPGHLLGVYDGVTGLAMEEWAYMGERPVASVRAGVIYPIETDHLMAPMRVLDPADAVVWSWENREPFGASAPAEGTVGGQTFSMGLRFPGQYADDESGLVSNGFRDYDVSSGRYAEVDPVGLSAGMNAYIYVNNRPMQRYDSAGLDDTFCMRDPSACGMSKPSPPDYYHLNINYLVGSFSLEVTSDGSIFVGTGAAHPGLPAAISPKKFGISLTSGTMVGCQSSKFKNREDWVSNFASGWSTGASAFYVVGGGYSTNSSGTAFEGGIGSPGYGVQAEYMHKIGNIGMSW